MKEWRFVMVDAVSVVLQALLVATGIVLVVFAAVKFAVVLIGTHAAAVNAKSFKGADRMVWSSLAVCWVGVFLFVVGVAAW